MFFPIFYNTSQIYNAGKDHLQEAWPVFSELSNPLKPGKKLSHIRRYWKMTVMQDSNLYWILELMEKMK